jgi:hypothetical protein
MTDREPDERAESRRIQWLLRLLRDEPARTLARIHQSAEREQAADDGPSPTGEQ